MQFPEDIDNINAFFESVEKGETYKKADGDENLYTKKFSGYYPIGSGNLWHSGVHIEYKSGEIIYPIISGGKVIAYRLEEKYRECPLPEKLTQSQLKNEFSYYVDKYEEKNEDGFVYYELKSNLKETDKTYSVSNNFILIKHEIIVNQLSNPLVFYSLYMNLAPVEKSSQNTNVVVHSKSHPFYPDFMCTDEKSKELKRGFQKPSVSEGISKIGKAGFLRGKRYIDFCVFMEKSLTSFREKANSKSSVMLFHHLDKKISLLKRGEKIRPVELYWPTGTEYKIIDRKEENGNRAFKFSVEKIRPYFDEKEAKVDEDYQINGKKIKILKTDHLKLTDKVISNDGMSFIGTDFVLTQSLLNRDFYNVGNSIVAFYLTSDFFNRVEYWSDGADITVTDHKINVYTKNPLIYDYIKVDDIEKISENYNKISDIDFTPIDTLSSSDKVYRIKGLKGAINEDLYISERDKGKCIKSAFDWSKWFFIKDDDKDNDIVCDRTFLVEFLINKFNNEIDEYNYEEKYIQKWWYGKYLTNIYLQNALNTDGTGYEFAKKIRYMFRRASCYHPLEWDKTLFSNSKISNKFLKVLGTPLASHIQKALENESSKSDIWTGALKTLFKKNCFYFVNPIYFARHLERANVLNFNPYANKYFSEIYCDNSLTEIFGEENLAKLKVLSNCGFAAIYEKTIHERQINVNGFACVTGFFNENYYEVHKNDKDPATGRKYTEYWHQGIDFRAPAGTKVVSLLNMKFIKKGKSNSMGDYILAQSIEDKNLYYLAVHLKNKKSNNVEYLKDFQFGDIIYAGQIVAETMDLGNASHLHSSVIRLPNGVPWNSVGGDGAYRTSDNSFPAFSNKHRNIMINPFNYGDLNTWQGKKS